MAAEVAVETDTLCYVCVHSLSDRELASGGHAGIDCLSFFPASFIEAKCISSASISLFSTNHELYTPLALAWLLGRDLVYFSCQLQGDLSEPGLQSANLLSFAVANGATLG